MAGKMFDQLRNLFNKDSRVTTDDKPESVYMMNRFLSLRGSSFMVAHDCNSIKGLQDWAAYCFLYNSIPLSKAPFSKYPKKLADKELSEKKMKVVKRVGKKFCATDFHAKQIVDLLEAQGIVLEANY